MTNLSINYDEEAEKLSMTYKILLPFDNSKVIPIKVKFSLENIIENILLALENEENREIINSSKCEFKVWFNYSMLKERNIVSFGYDEIPCNLTWEGGYLTKWDKLKIIKTSIKLLPELNQFEYLLKAKSYTEMEKLTNL